MRAPVHVCVCKRERERLPAELILSCPQLMAQCVHTHLSSTSRIPQSRSRGWQGASRVLAEGGLAGSAGTLALRCSGALRPPNTHRDAGDGELEVAKRRHLKCQLLAQGQDLRVHSTKAGAHVAAHACVPAPDPCLTSASSLLQLV